jgi:WD40 repeat protein
MVWDLKDGKERFEFKEPRDQVGGLLFSAGGKRLLAVDWGGFACSWDVGTGKVLKTAELDPGVARGPWYISPDHEMVVAPPRGFSWDYGLLNSRKLTTERVPFLESLNDTAWSSDGKSLLVAKDDLVRLFDITRKLGKEVHRMHTAKVRSVSLSPDGELAASGSEDRTAVVWDLGVGKERATYKGFDGPVRVRFSPDGKMLLAWAVNGTTVRRWDVVAGKELPALRGHDEGVQWGFFRAGGKHLVVAERNGKVTLYGVAGLPR